MEDKNECRRIKKILSEYDDDLPICIGIYQVRGANFATDIKNVEALIVEDFEYGEEKQIVLTQGNQTGIIDYEE
mgnify:CR=1 FL=1